MYSLTYLATVFGEPYEGSTEYGTGTGTRQVYWGENAPGFPWQFVEERFVLPTAVPVPNYTTPFQQKEIGMQGVQAPISFPRPAGFNPRYGHFALYTNPVLGGTYMWHRASFVFNTSVSQMPTIGRRPGDVEEFTEWRTVPVEYPFPNMPSPWAPSVFPHELPIGMPSPSAPPLNFPRPDPWSPESPSRGPRPDEVPKTEPAPVPKPSPLPEPAPNPAPRPNVIQNPFPDAPLDSWLPSPRPTPRPQVRPQRPQPPRKNEKEKKARMGAVAGAIWAAFGPITETVDFVDVLYEALPRNIKRDAYNKLGRQPNPIERAELIYRNINQMDVGKALTGWAQNEIEDFIIGKFGKGVGKASQKDGRPIGYGAGPAI